MTHQLNYDAFVKIAAGLGAPGEQKSANAGMESSNVTGSMQMPNTHSVASETSGGELDKALKENAMAPTTTGAAANVESNANPAQGVGLNADSPDKKTEQVATSVQDPGTSLAGAEAGKVANYAAMSTEELTAAYKKSANTLLAHIKTEADSAAGQKTAEAVTPATTSAATAAASPAAAAGYSDAAAAGQTAKMAANKALAADLLRLGVLGGELVATKIKTAMHKQAEGGPPPGDPTMDAPMSAAPPMAPPPPGAGPAGPPDGGPAAGGPPPGAGGAEGDAGGTSGGDMSPDQIIQEFLSAMAEMGITPEQVEEIIEKSSPAASPPPAESAPPEEKKAWQVFATVRERCKFAKQVRNQGRWSFVPASNKKTAEMRANLRNFLVELTSNNTK